MYVYIYILYTYIMYIGFLRAKWVGLTNAKRLRGEQEESDLLRSQLRNLHMLTYADVC
jgi:hypothetical protein